MGKKHLLQGSAALLALLICLAAVQPGYAARSTEMTAGGMISAQGRWQVDVTAATLTLGEGAALSGAQQEANAAFAASAAPEAASVPVDDAAARPNQTVCAAQEVSAPVGFAVLGEATEAEIASETADTLTKTGDADEGESAALDAQHEETSGEGETGGASDPGDPVEPSAPAAEPEEDPESTPAPSTGPEESPESDPIPAGEPEKTPATVNGAEESEAEGTASSAEIPGEICNGLEVKFPSVTLEAGGAVIYHITVTNSGTTDAVLQRDTLTGLEDFAVEGLPEIGTVLPAGQSAQLELTVRAVSAGQAHVTLTLTYEAPKPEEAPQAAFHIKPSVTNGKS